MSKLHIRPFVGGLRKALADDLPFLHIITGPRQVGKTTAALQICEEWDGETVYAAADAPLPPGPEWISVQWELALAKTAGGRRVLLVLDEIQKVAGWSEAVKLLWDRERRERRGIRVILLGSSSLLIQHGLSESLAGRFLSYRAGHWGFGEMRSAFGWSLDEWLYFGGYPGAAVLKADEGAWRRYVTDSLIETVLSRDVLQLATVAKPALLRHLFGLAVSHPAEILSYNKMLGQLQDAGNTTTLAHYLRLLDAAFLVGGLDIYRAGRGVKRAGSPKLVFWNNALITAFLGRPAVETLGDPARRGRLVENAVGGRLLGGLDAATHQVYYWRERDREVDFVVKTPGELWGVEVKSGASRDSGGVAAFLRRWPRARPLLIGAGGMPLEEFFLADPAKLFQ